MVYQKYEYDAFRVFTIQTDQFKNCHMEVIFQADASEGSLMETCFLSDMMSYTSKNFPTRRDFIIRLEELYNTYFYGVTTKVGNALLTNFVFDFLDPKFVSEENYLDDCMSFCFDTIMNPNITSKSFDFRSFQIVKNHLKADIEAYKENPTNYAVRNTLKALFPNSITSKSVLGTLEELEKITPESLVLAYQKMMKHSHCDIYLVGNLDMDQVAKMILRYFRNPVIKNHELSVYVKNPLLRSVKKVCEESSFVQSTLVVAYQMPLLMKKEEQATLSVFGEMLCGGSLNSKLYQSLRNEHSLCYRIQTIYQKFDGLFFVVVGLDHQNQGLAVKLIKKAIKEMADGTFSDSELEMAKKQLSFAISMSMDNQSSLVNNYFFHNLTSQSLFQDRKEEILNVTKNDIRSFAKKVHLAMVYELKEGIHEGD